MGGVVEYLPLTLAERCGHVTDQEHCSEFQAGYYIPEYTEWRK